MKATYFSLVILAVFVTLASSQKAVKPPCNNRCKANQVCEENKCVTFKDCDCAVNPKFAKPCADYTGEPNKKLCELADCCYRKDDDGKERCYQKIENHPRKVCDKEYAFTERVKTAWDDITRNDCYCTGGCYEDLVDGAPLALQLKYGPCWVEQGEQNQIDLHEACKQTDVCKDDHAFCDDGKCECKHCHYDKDGMCVPKLRLGEVCKAGDEAIHENAGCVAGVITCQDGYYQDGFECLEQVPLKKPCTVDEACLTKNAECVFGTDCDSLEVGQCGCKDGYEEQGDECVSDVALGDECTEDDKCADANAECTAGVLDTCQCKLGFFEKDGVCKEAIPLDKECDAKDKCADSLAECTGGLCKCKAGHTVQDGKCSGKVDLHKPCTDKSVCADGNAACYGGKCECNQDYHDKANKGVCVAEVDNGEKCDKDDVCKDGDAKCTDGVCKCGDGFYEKDGVCTEKVKLGEKCGKDDVCADGNAQCLLGECACPAGFFAKKDTCQPKKKLDESCDADDQFVDPLASCQSGKVKCKDNHIVKDGVCSGKIPLNEKCEPGDVCDGDNTLCVGGKCDCKIGFYQKDKKCVELIPLGQKCEQCDVCAGNNAECDDDVCKCKEGFFEKDDDCEEVIPLDDPCDVGDTCEDGQASCVGGKCKCDSAYYNDGGKCELKLPLGHTCSDQNCADPKASCENDKCQCIDGYFAKNDVCTALVPLGQKCDKDDVCEDKLAKCPLGGGVCACPKDHIIKNGACSGKIPTGQACDKDDVCAEDKAACTGGKCLCKVGYVQKGAVCADLIPLNDPCVTGDVCEDKNAKCQGLKCLCVADYYEKNKVCVPMIELDGKCDVKVDKCKGNFVSCRTEKCRCNTGTFQRGKECVPEIPLGGKCALSDVCKDKMAKCKDGTCQCQPQYKELGGKCVGGIPTGQPCKAGQLCQDENAGCVSGKCQCNKDYVLNKGVCVVLTEVCHAKKFNFILIVDTSRSIDANEMADVKKFLHTLLDRFDIGEDESRFGIIPYGTKTGPLTNIHGPQGYDKDLLTKKIDEIVYCANIFCQPRGPATGTPEALIAAMDMIDTLTPADLLDREVVVMWFTDGYTNVGSFASAMARLKTQLSKPTKFSRYALGVDGYRMTELEQFVGDGNKDNIVTADRFTDMLGVIGTLQAKVCVSSPDPSAKPEPPLDFNDTPKDMVFAIEASSEVTAENLQYFKDTIKRILLQYTISDDQTRVSIIVFGRYANALTKLTDGNDRDLVLDYIQDIEACPAKGSCEVGDGTNVNVATKAMAAIFEDGKKNNGGIERKQYGFLLYGGEAPDSEVKGAVDSVPDGVKMFTIGTGKAKLDDLKDIAGDDKRAFYEGSGKDIPDKSKPIVDIIDKDFVTITCKDQHMDVVLVVDNSRSIDSQEMAQQKAFLREVVKTLTVSEAGNHVGIVKYGYFVQTPQNLLTGTDLQDVYDVIDQIEYCPTFSCALGPSTNTPGGISAMIAQFQKAPKDKDRKRMAILVTDGATNVGSVGAAVTELTNFNKANADSPITMICVGIDGAVDTELEQYALGIKSNIYVADQFDQLGNVLSNMKKQICTGGPAPPAPPKPVCTDRVYDVDLIVDNSRSIDATEMAQMKEFLKNLVEQFKFGGKSRVGIIKFGFTSEITLKVTDGTTLEIVEAVIDKIENCDSPYCALGPATNTPSGILKAVQDMQSAGKHAGRERLVILIVDGKTNVGNFESACSTADTALEGVLKFAVGIDQADQKELDRFTGDANRTFMAQKFTDLKDKFSSLSAKVCK